MIFCYTFALAFAINFAFAFKSCSLKDLHRQRSSTRSVRFFSGRVNETNRSIPALPFPFGCGMTKIRKDVLI